MGTRSLTFVYNEGQTTPAHRAMCMYRHWDGYPSGHGKELAAFITSGKMVNGLGAKTEQRQFNGVGCFAAQMVCEFKDDAGGIYLYPTNSKDCWQDYEYHVYYNEGTGFRIVVKEGSTRAKTIFDGSLEEFTPWCVAERD